MGRGRAGAIAVAVVIVVVIGSRRRHRGQRHRLYKISRYPCAHPFRASVFKATGAQALRACDCCLRAVHAGPSLASSSMV